MELSVSDFSAGWPIAPTPALPRERGRERSGARRTYNTSTAIARSSAVSCRNRRSRSSRYVAHQSQSSVSAITSPSTTSSRCTSPCPSSQSPSAGAIANAIHNATGVRLRDYPITLEKIIEGLPDVA